MIAIEAELKKAAADLLSSGEAQMVLGFGPGSEATRTTPVFITGAGDTEKLVFNPFCVNNLVKYLIDLKDYPGKIAICVKGCDSRAVNRLLQDKQVDRNKVFILGLPCPGLLDPEKAAAVIDPSARLLTAEMEKDGVKITTDRGNYSLPAGFFMDKCRRCAGRNPVVYDRLVGQPLKENETGDDFAEVKNIEALPPEEKNAYWDRQFSRCLRCYACRNVCPACSCRECVFDRAEPGWVARANNLSNNTAFHLVRAFHVAGRCVDCGECQRVCPVHIPVGILNRKILMDIKQMYDEPTPGISPDRTPVLGGFHTGDPDEFM